LSSAVLHASLALMSLYSCYTFNVTDIHPLFHEEFFLTVVEPENSNVATE
jgi:hypothetical protein